MKAAFLYWEWRTPIAISDLHDRLILEFPSEGRSRFARVRGSLIGQSGHGPFQPWTHHVYRADVTGLCPVQRRTRGRLTRKSSKIVLRPPGFAGVSFPPGADDPAESSRGLHARVSPMCVGAVLVLVVDAPTHEAGITLLYDSLSATGRPCHSADSRRFSGALHSMSRPLHYSLELPGVLGPSMQWAHWIRASSMRSKIDPWSEVLTDRTRSDAASLRVTQQVRSVDHFGVSEDGLSSRFDVFRSAVGGDCPGPFSLSWLDVLWCC